MSNDVIRKALDDLKELANRCYAEPRDAKRQETYRTASPTISRLRRHAKRLEHPQKAILDLQYIRIDFKGLLRASDQERDHRNIIDRLNRLRGRDRFGV